MSTLYAPRARIGLDDEFFEAGNTHLGDLNPRVIEAYNVSGYEPFRDFG